MSLDKILSCSGILDSIFVLLESDDLALAAEAGSILRTWTMDSRNARLLYANCFFPKVLNVSGIAVRRVSGIASLKPSEVEVLEHLILSILLVIWAVIEEIPASLPQLNQSKTIELLLSSWGQASFLKADTLLVTLQVGLTVFEDNLSVLSGLQGAQIISLLDKRPFTIEAGHLYLLAQSIIVQVQGKELSAEFLLGLDCEGNFEMLRDILEMLANNATSLVNLGDSGLDRLKALISSLPALKELPEGSVIVRECWGRVFGCINNALLADDRALISIGYRQAIWSWCLRDVIGSPGVPISDALAELLRNCCLLAHGEYAIPYEAADDDMMRGLVENNLKDDTILSNIVSIPALLYNPSFSHADWLNSLILGLFNTERSLTIILALAEVVEELLKHNLLSHKSIQFIEVNYNPIMNELNKFVRSLRNSGEKNARQDELEYIKGVFRALCQ